MTVRARLRRASEAFEGGDHPAVVAALRPILDDPVRWAALGRADGADRGRVYDRLAALAPPPDGVTRDAVLALDRDAMDRWRTELEWTW